MARWIWTFRGNDRDHWRDALLTKRLLTVAQGSAPTIVAFPLWRNPDLALHPLNEGLNLDHDRWNEVHWPIPKCEREVAFHLQVVRVWWNDQLRRGRKVWSADFLTGMQILAIQSPVREEAFRYNRLDDRLLRRLTNMQQRQLWLRYPSRRYPPHKGRPIQVLPEEKDVRDRLRSHLINPEP